MPPSVLLKSFGAYALPLVTIPVVFLFVAPEEYGYYALYVAAVSSIAPVSSLRLDLMFPVEADASARSRMRNVALLSVASFMVVGLVVAALWFVFAKQASTHFTLMFWVSIGILLQGLGQVRQADMVFSQRPDSIISARLWFGLAIGLAQPMAAFLYPRFESLVVSDIVARLAFFVALKSPSAVGIHRGLGGFGAYISDLGRIKSQLFYSVGASAINGLSVQAPIIVAGSLYGANVAGLVGASYKLLSVPVRIISQAIQPYFLSEYAAVLRVGAPRRYVVKKYVLLSSVIAAPIYFLAAAFISPAITFFPDGWADLPTYFMAFVPLFYMSFVAIPVSQALIPSRRSSVQFHWELGRMFALGLAILVITLLSVGAEHGMLGLAVVQCLSYFALIILVLKDK